MTFNPNVPLDIRERLAAQNGVDCGRVETRDPLDLPAGPRQAEVVGLGRFRGVVLVARCQRRGHVWPHSASVGIRDS